MSSDDLAFAFVCVAGAIVVGFVVIALARWRR